MSRSSSNFGTPRSARLLDVPQSLDKPLRRDELGDPHLLFPRSVEYNQRRQPGDSVPVLERLDLRGLGSGRPSVRARSTARDADVSQEMAVGSGAVAVSGVATGASSNVAVSDAAGRATLSPQPAMASMRRPRNAFRMAPFYTMRRGGRNTFTGVRHFWRHCVPQGPRSPRSTRSCQSSSSAPPGPRLNS